MARDSAQIAVPMSNGRTMVVTVIDVVGRGWLANDVQDDVGN
jgi:hypothetical protein